MDEFVVIGLGKFGYNIAKQLALKGKKVIAIDTNPKQIDQIKDIVSDSVIGDVKDKQFLSEFIDEKVEAAFISTGDEMFDSILAVHHLKEIGVQNIIVKANDETHARILRLMGATEIIFPEKDIAGWWANKFSEPNLIEYLPLSEEYSIVEYACPDEFAGKTLKNLQLPSRYKILVVAIKDVMKNDFILMPSADHILQPDTILILMGKKEDINTMKLRL